ncbi:DUF4383 domain-containing protein [Mycobacterium sp. 852002-51057_SCH5723018]|uniref:DUF4383 domain-containing protein n=1 Tax=Mycobacterium sp. 852002-51057_SCH5723018 TaxID=1834094 RepID=UPI000801B398|nr:DUF4383 domain-containing protein [Mycobacterium sp. 852002-51057_SCH5723018]OBG30157.1 hypothetical protein A5764_19520 [Mycobacterium sp. 852002-51057_SCH5723018]
MPVTAGHVPGLTSGLRRIRTDPERFRSGRWFLLAEGALVSAFGIAGLVSAAVHPHAGPTGAPVFGLASTPAHSAMLLAFGVVGIAAVVNRRAAVTVTAFSSVAYLMLLFFSSVATAREKPTPMGFHAADIVLHGVLAVVNLALLMWLIPDELGDEAWVPRRRRGRERERRQPSASESVTEPAAVSPSTASTNRGSSPPAAAAARPPESDAHRGPPQRTVAQPMSQQPNDPPAQNTEESTHLENAAARSTNPLVLRRVMVPAVLATVVGIVIWMRRR